MQLNALHGDDGAPSEYAGTMGATIFPAPRGAQAAATRAASRAVRCPGRPGSLVTAGPLVEASEFSRLHPLASPAVQLAI